jgi:hypothetical protein
VGTRPPQSQTLASLDQRRKVDRGPHSTVAARRLPSPAGCEPRAEQGSTSSLTPVARLQWAHHVADRLTRMLWIERQVVARLVSPQLDPRWQSAIEDYVDGALHAMPQHLRTGIVAESLVFGARPYFQRALCRFDPGSLDRRVGQWSASRIDIVRQYIRLLSSLVLFAENELVPETER